MIKSNIGLNRTVWQGNELPTPEDCAKLVKEYLTSDEYKYLEYIGSYYDSQNAELLDRWSKKNDRGAKPNWFVPTAYYTTLVDSMSGYLFNNVVYSSGEEESELCDVLNKTFDDINIDVVDMQTGIRALAFNKGCEIVYTEGDGVNQANIHVISVDPRQILMVYDKTVEPKIIIGIRILKSPSPDYKHQMDIITAKSWTSHYVKDDDSVVVNPGWMPRTTYWTECPCIEYNTETLNGNTAFHQVIPYIAALDALVTGNANEIDKLADAILKLSASLSPEQKENLSDYKVIEGMTKEDIAEYIQRNTDPTFREYLSKLLIQEIHKHSHVIDFYSPDTGISGDASGKALQTRMVDMNMFCDRTEKTVKLGWKKRINLFKEFLIKDKRAVADTKSIDPIFNRTKIIGLADIAPPLEQVSFISKKTKQEECGLDPAVEEDRLESEKPETTDITDNLDPLRNIKDRSNEITIDDGVDDDTNISQDMSQDDDVE